MRKNLGLSIACAAALALGACAAADNFIQTDIIDPAASLISNPNTKIVVQTVASDTKAVACLVAQGTSFASTIESNPQLNKSASLVGTNYKINTISAAVCTGISGVVNGTVTAPAGSPVVAATS